MQILSMMSGDTKYHFKVSIMTLGTDSVDNEYTNE